jgi:hypothetical protein
MNIRPRDTTSTVVPRMRPSTACVGTSATPPGNVVEAVMLANPHEDVGAAMIANPHGNVDTIVMRTTTTARTRTTGISKKRWLRDAQEERGLAPDARHAAHANHKKCRENTPVWNTLCVCTASTVRGA